MNFWHCQTFDWYIWVFYRIATTVLLVVEETHKTNLNTENVQKQRWNDGMTLLGAKKIMHDCKALLINNLINYKHQQKQRLILQKDYCNIVYWFLYQGW